MTDHKNELDRLRGATTVVYVGLTSLEGVCRCGDRIRLGQRVAQMANGENVHEDCAQ